MTRRMRGLGALSLSLLLVAGCGAGSAENPSAQTGWGPVIAGHSGDFAEQDVPLAELVHTADAVVVGEFGDLIGTPQSCGWAWGSPTPIAS